MHFKNNFRAPKIRKITTGDLLQVINLPGIICFHALGKKHTNKHRMIVGSGIMVIGVIIAKSVHHPFFLHIATDILGYWLHALGGIPFLDAVVEHVNKKLEEEAKEIKDGVQVADHHSHKFFNNLRHFNGFKHLKDSAFGPIVIYEI